MLVEGAVSCSVLQWFYFSCVLILSPLKNWKNLCPGGHRHPLIQSDVKRIPFEQSQSLWLKVWLFLSFDAFYHQTCPWKSLFNMCQKAAAANSIQFLGLKKLSRGWLMHPIIRLLLFLSWGWENVKTFKSSLASLTFSPKTSSRELAVFSDSFISTPVGNEVHKAAGFPGMDIPLILDALSKHCTISSPLFHAAWEIEFHFGNSSSSLLTRQVSHSFRFSCNRFHSCFSNYWSCIRKILSTLFAFKRAADFYWSCKRCSAYLCPKFVQTTPTPQKKNQTQLSSQDFHKHATLGINLKVEENQHITHCKLKNRRSYCLVCSGFSWDCLDMNQRKWTKALFTQLLTLWCSPCLWATSHPVFHEIHGCISGLAHPSGISPAMLTCLSISRNICSEMKHGVTF